MPVTEPIEIPIEGNPSDFIADAKKVQEQMDILKYRLEKAGVSQAAYNKAVSNSRPAMTQQAAAVKQTSISITDLRSAYMIAADAARIAGQVWQATGQEFVNYAEQVKNMSRALGESAEETSRIIQVADDVRISYDSLKVAMKEAQKDGVQPNIEGLAKLADQYKAIQSPTERTKFLLDKFGKSGLEMGKLMEKGGDGIRKMSDSISDNLIMTDKGIKASDEYQKSLDELKDTAYGVQVEIGSKLTPVMNAFMKVVLSDIQAVGTFRDVLSGDKSLSEAAKEVADIINNNGFDLFGLQIGNVTEETENLTPALEDNAGALDGQKEAVAAAKDALDNYKSMLESVSQANLDMEGMSRKIAQDQRQYEEDYASAVKDVQDAKEELAKAEEKASDKSRQNAQNIIIKQRELQSAIQEYGNGSEQAAKKRLALDKAMTSSNGDDAIVKATEKLGEAEKAVTDLSVEWHKASNEMIYDMILVGLSAGGLLDSEQKALDEYAVKAGIKTQADIDEANRRREIADAAINGILQSEDVLAEQRKVDAETARLTDAVTSAEVIAANANEAASMGAVTQATQTEIQKQAELAKAAAYTARAYATINMGGSSKASSGSLPQAGKIGGRDSGGTGIAGTPYMIGTGAQPEIFIPNTNGTFIPNADKKIGGTVYNIVINNPKKETAENSIRSALKNLSYTGAAA